MGIALSGRTSNLADELSFRLNLARLVAFSHHGNRKSPELRDLEQCCALAGKPGSAGQTERSRAKAAANPKTAAPAASKRSRSRKS